MMVNSQGLVPPPGGPTPVQPGPPRNTVCRFSQVRVRRVGEPAAGIGQDPVGRPAPGGTPR